MTDTKGQNNVNKIISRRKELKITQEQIAEALGMTKQRWSQIEHACLKNDMDRTFSSKEMQQLNLLLHFDLEQAVYSNQDPMIFNERAIAESLFEEALKRDFMFADRVLECICEASEKELAILGQTATILIKNKQPYTDDVSLIFLSAIRNAVTEAIQKFFPDDTIIDSIIERERSSAKEYAEESKRKLMKQGKTDKKNVEDVCNQRGCQRLIDAATEQLTEQICGIIRNEIRTVVRNTIEKKIENCCLFAQK